MRILLDFDGTIIDLWKRYYHVFCDINDCQDVLLQDYIGAKRAFQRDEQVARELGVHLKKEYFYSKRKLLEEQEYLDMDTLLLAKSKLLSFMNKNQSNILTYRRNKDNLFLEMNRLGLEQLCEKTVVLNPENMTKKEWIEHNSFSERLIVIGDGKAELETRNCPNVKIFMVNSGLTDVGKMGIKGIEVIEDLEEFINVWEC